MTAGFSIRALIASGVVAAALIAPGLIALGAIAAVGTACLVSAPLVHAQTANAVVASSASPSTSPLGRWQTVDDKTGKVKSIVEISEENGTLSGTIEQLFDPPVPHPTCYLCTGQKKDVPLVGLQVLWGFHADGSSWTGGQVLDPETGKIYRSSLTVEDGGKQLRLRGYIGIPLFGRTETWVRAE